MAVRHKNKPKPTRRHKNHRPPKEPKHLTPKQSTALSAKEYGVPFWILWGIAGAESTWGQGGDNLFGLLDAAEGVNVSDWRAASKQAAKTLAGLKKQYGGWAQAIEHYSGYSYNIQHPKELAADKGVTPQNSEQVQNGTLENVDFSVPGIGNVPFPDLGNIFGSPGEFGGEHSYEFGGPGTGPLGHEAGKPLQGGLEIFPGGIIQAFEDFDAIAKLLVDPQFWLRVGEAVGGIVLLYMALKALTGTDIPGAGTAKSYAKAAAFKRLPPKQRVK